MARKLQHGTQKIHRGHLLLLGCWVMVWTLNGCTADVANLEFRIAELEKKLEASTEAESYTPGLGLFMQNMQAHHAKLYYAGLNGNWDLAGFELHELEERLEEVAELIGVHNEVDLAKLIPALMQPSIEKLEKTIEAKDAALFSGDYSSLTESCNSCHVASKYSIIRIQVPTPGAFPNQDFTAAGK